MLCEICNKDIRLVNGCIGKRMAIDGKMYHRGRVMPNSCVYGRCVDCNAKVGTFHHWGCDQEICPACGQQILSCDCENIGVEED